MAEILGFISQTFGILLNWLYNFFNNYGIAIILFSIALRVILIPITIKQQKSMKKSAEMQEKVQEIQDKYKNNPEKLNQETIELYKKEKMSPFSRMFKFCFAITYYLSSILFSKPTTYFYERY